MKIGILTLQLLTNYGCLLQAFATQQFLKKLNIDSILISHYNGITLRTKVLSIIKRLVLKGLGRYHGPVRGWMTNDEYKKISKNTESFINRNIVRTSTINLLKDKSIIEEYSLNGILVGSDQCWRPRTARKIEKLFLENYSHCNIRRASYAASFGTSEWEYTSSQTDRCKVLVQKFDGISVREDSGVILCKEKFNIEATHVVDPTLLLNKDDYINLLDEKDRTQVKDDSLMVYVLDKSTEKQHIIDLISSKLDLKVNSVMPKNNFSDVGSTKIDDCVFPPLEHWIKGFLNCEFVLTDSFHGTVFAIIFNKPFISIANRNRGITRFTSLLNVFGLQDRLIYSLEDLSDTQIFKPIDFEVVNNIREKEIKKSKEFILKTFGNE